MSISGRKIPFFFEFLFFYISIFSIAHGWEYLPERGILNYPNIEATGYISKEKVIGVGEIVKTGYEDFLLGSKWEFVYVSIDKGLEPKDGDEFIIFRNTRIVKPEIGYLVESIGRLRIIEKGKGLNKGVIVQSYKAVNVGDRLLPSKYGGDSSQSPKIEIKAPLSPLRGHILLMDENKEISGKGDIVYIDLGSLDGVQVGNCFTVYRIPSETLLGFMKDEEDRKGYKALKGSIETIEEPIGELIVLSVQEESSTALVVKSRVQILRGDWIKSPCGWEDKIVKVIPEPPEVKVEREEIKIEEKPSPPVAIKEPPKGPEVDLEAIKRREAEIKAFMEVDVHFDFDRYTLTDEAKKILKEKADWLNRNPDIKVIIEGHCDERGTNSYNLALGHRRAQMVKSYLVNLGVEDSRFSIISYGEERPIDPGHDESAWKKNRRVHFVVESR